jgi:hypothetical protein
MASIVDEEWKVVTALLPKDWRTSAFETGAIKRARGGLSDPETLLRVLLLHVGGGLSLRSATARAAVLGFADVSDVALLKRLRTSEVWLRTLAKQMFEQTRFGTRIGAFASGRRFRAFDATTVEEPGATGTDWRVHFGLTLPDLRCDFFEVTDNKGGETFTRFPIAKGDVVLGDRGYSHRRGVAYVLDAGADVVVRLSSTAFPLVHKDGSALDILVELRRLRGNKPKDLTVEFVHDKRRHQLRLCAVRKTKVAAELAKHKAQRDAAKKGKKILPRTLEAAEYIFVLTSLSSAEFDAARVLELYRARWQIELVFKRMKSLMRLGHLPKYTDSSSRAWLEGKLLTVLLVERLLGQAKFFSPWGFDISPPEPVARVRRGA